MFFSSQLHPRSFLGPLPLDTHRELEAVELIEGERAMAHRAALRQLPQIRIGRRAMQMLQRHRNRCQLAREALRLGNRTADFRRGLVERHRYQRRIQTLRDALGNPIHRPHRTPLVIRLGAQLGLRHFDMIIGRLGDAPVRGDAEAIGHLAAHVRRQVEPDQPKLRAGRVGERGGDEATPARAGHRALANARQRALDHRDSAGFELRDGPALAPVLVARGQMKQEVLDGDDALVT